MFAIPRFQRRHAQPGDRPLDTVPFYLTVAVWGRDFTDLFIDICLPSLLAPGNIPALAHRDGSRFFIFTTEEDAKRLVESAAYECLIAHIKVDIEIINETIEDNHLTMSNCHRELMNLADRDGAAAVFLSPDNIWGNGVFAVLDRKFRAGKRVIFMIGIRLNRDDFMPVAIERFRSPDGRVLDVDSRALCALGLKHLHWTTKEHFWRAGTGTGLLPTGLLWEVQGEGLHARFFHLHPLLVYPRKKFARFHSSIDDDLVLAACPDAADHYVVTDSDEMLVLELSSPIHRIAGPYRKESIEDVAAWALVGANANHRQLVQHPIRLHWRDIDPARWDPVGREADQVVDEALRLIANKLARVLMIVTHVDDWIKQQIFSRYPILSRAWTKLFGQWPDVTILHWHWMWARSIRAVLKPILDRNGKTILWLHQEKFVDMYFLEAMARSYAGDVVHVWVEEALASEAAAEEFAARHSGRFDVVIYDRPASEAMLVADFRFLHSVLATDGTLYLGCEVLSSWAPHVGRMRFDEKVTPYFTAAQPVRLGGSGLQILRYCHKGMKLLHRRVKKIAYIGGMLSLLMYVVSLFSIFPVLNFVGYIVDTLDRGSDAAGSMNIVSLTKVGS